MDKLNETGDLTRSVHLEFKEMGWRRYLRANFACQYEDCSRRAGLIHD
jgi:hypothetical protein